MKAALAPNPSHLAAALSYRRAANAVRHARLSPWMAERELDSAAFWKRSAAHHRRMAGLCSEVRAVNALTPRPRLSPLTTWEREVATLLASRAAVLADVE